MKYLKQFLIILAISFIGEVLHELLPLPVPASIYGILILFILLKTKLVPLSSVRDTARFLVEIMPVMFIPAAAGLLTSWEEIRGMLLPLCVIIPVSTCFVMLVTGKVAGWMIGRKEKRESRAGQRG